MLKRIAPYVTLLLVPFLFYWKLFAWNPEERKIFRGDFLNQHYVWKSYSLERIRSGELPSDRDPALVAEALAGPLFYRRLMTPMPFPPDEVHRIVELVLD